MKIKVFQQSERDNSITVYIDNVDYIYSLILGRRFL